MGCASVPGSQTGYGQSMTSHFTFRAACKIINRMNDTRPERILVVGATGMLGAPVTRRLIADGYIVRILSRDRRKAETLFGKDVEIVQADVTRPESLPSAVAHCDGLYISLRGSNNFDSYEAVEARGLQNVLSAARASPIARVAYISGAGQSEGNESLLPVLIKLQAERQLRSCGMAFTIFRCTHFMESLDLFVHGNRVTVLGHQPHAYHYIAAADYAAMVSRSFRCAQAANQILTVWGPEALTMHAALEIYVRELAPELKLGRMPLPVARLIGRLTRNQDLRFAAELFAGFSRVGEVGDPQPANSMLGAPATNLLRWCAQRKVRLTGEQAVAAR